MDYSTKNVSSQLLNEIKAALQSVNFGSIEIYINDNSVTQITTRTIKKTSVTVNKKSQSSSVKKNNNKEYFVDNVLQFNSSEQ
jgi:hypothetical protein